MEAIEHYTASHGGDSFDQILEWPWQRFDAAYEAMCKRELVEELRQRKISMIAALWSNGNIGGDDLQAAVDELESQFDDSVLVIYEGPEAIEDPIDFENDPFYSAAKRGIQKIQDTMPVVDDSQNQDQVRTLLDPEAFDNDQG